MIVKEVRRIHLATGFASREKSSVDVFVALRLPGRPFGFAVLRTWTSAELAELLQHLGVEARQLSFEIFPDGSARGTLIPATPAQIAAEAFESDPHDVGEVNVLGVTNEEMFERVRSWRDQKRQDLLSPEGY